MVLLTSPTAAATVRRQSSLRTLQDHCYGLLMRVPTFRLSSDKGAFCFLLLLVERVLAILMSSYCRSCGAHTTSIQGMARLNWKRFVLYCMTEMQPHATKRRSQRLSFQTSESTWPQLLVLLLGVLTRIQQ